MVGPVTCVYVSQVGIANSLPTVQLSCFAYQVVLAMLGQMKRVALT